MVLVTNYQLEPSAPMHAAVVTSFDHPLTWIQIGSVAGLELALPSAWLRAARLQLVGSGQGSVPTRDILAELPALAAHLTAGDYAVDAAPAPLSDVERIWTAPNPDGRRIVFVP